MTKKATTPKPPSGTPPTKPAAKPKATRKKAAPKTTAPVVPPSNLPPIAPAPAQQQATAPAVSPQATAPAPQAVPPTQHPPEVVPFSMQELNGIPPLDAAERQRWDNDRANAGFPPYMNPVAAAINAGKPPPATAHGDYQETAPALAPVPEPEPEPVGPSKGDLNAAIARYHEIDAINAEISKRLKPTLDAHSEEQEAIKVYLEQAMAQLGTGLINTESGSAYTRTTEYVSVKKGEWDKVLNFIATGGHWEMLQKKVTVDPTKVILADLATRGEVIPGIEFGQKIALTISVPKKKPASRKKAAT